MVNKEYISKRHFVDGWSIREISRTLKISRQTVRKMLNDAEISKYQLYAARPCCATVHLDYKDHASETHRVWNPIVLEA